MGEGRLLLLLAAACAAKTTTPQPKSAETNASSVAGTARAPAASGAPAPQPAPASGLPAAPSGPTTNVTLADVGLEATSLDRSVDPCVDFYQFACGGWLAANQIPSDRSRWGRFSEVDENNQLALKAVLEQAAANSGPATKQLGDFYASCMDEAAIEKAGTAAVQPLLDKTLKVKDARSWLAAVIELHKHGVWVAFRSGAEPGLRDPTTYISQLDAAPLGLPDREYYLNAQLKDQLDGYKQHVARTLTLAGVAKAESAAAEVLAIETELARLTKSATEKRDVQAMNNIVELKTIAKQARSVDWKAYYKGLGITPTPRLEVGTPKYVAGLDGVRKRFKPAQWSGYFTYHLLREHAHALPRAYQDEAFTRDKLLSGAAEQPARFKRCIAQASYAVGELLGRAYTDKHFSMQTKQAATTLVDAIAAAMHDELGKLDWMSDKTKQVAQAKLGKLAKMIGYPDRWRTYDFDIKRDDFAGNMLRATAFEVRRVLGRAGKPYDRTEWLIPTYIVDAYFHPSANVAVLPAGILQPPFFGSGRSIAANLGGIGMVIGHELTHGFDDQGAKFTADGKLENWWAAEDKAKFEDKGKCLAAMYDTFEAQPKQFINGKLTLGENIADLGGVKMAFKAYRSLRSGAERVVVADGFTEDQQFFLGVAQAWCTKVRPAEAQRLLVTDPHAPAKFRVYGALRNLPEFSQAFQCAAGTPMHPAQTCPVW